MNADILDRAAMKAAGRRWQVKVNGCFAILAEDARDVTPRGRKSRAIIAYLASHPGALVPRERLMELLWGDRSQPQARDSLRQSLAEIRRSTGDLIESTREHLRIDDGRIAEVEEHADGDCEPFDDLNHVTPEFDDWLAAERERRRSGEWNALHATVSELLLQEEPVAALPLIERMRQIDPYNEDWLRLAMRAEFQAGHPAAIQKRFREMADCLKRDLGVSPAPETRALHDELLAELSGGLLRQPGDFPGAHAGDGQRAAADDRYQSPMRAGIWHRSFAAVGAGAALVGALGITQSSQSVASQTHSVAVLPFVASSGVHASLAEGLSDELISTLARVDGLRVIGRMSSDQFRGGAVDLRKASRSLNADYVVEGKVGKIDGQTHVLVSLVRGTDGSIVWTRRYSRLGRNVQTIPSAVGSAVGRSLGVGQVASTPALISTEAYGLYVRAKSLIRERDEKSLIQAIELLRQAVRMDQSFAPAWAQLGGALVLARQKDVTVEPGGGRPVRLTPRNAVQRALELDPLLAEAHSLMGLVEHTSASAPQHFRRALQLDPGDTQTLYWLSSSLYSRGEFDAATEILDRVVALDPLWAVPVTEAIEASFARGDRAAAMRHLQTFKSGNRDAHMVEFFATIAEGDYSRGIQAAFSQTEPHGWVVPALIALGFQREAMLVGASPAVKRDIMLGAPPPIPAIIDHLEEDAEYGREMLAIYIVQPLSRDLEWQELSALYDAGPGIIGGVKGSDPQSRNFRVMLGPHFALALNSVGRKREAASLALRILDDVDHILRNAFVPPNTLIEIAGAEALLGRRDRALAHLERAFASGWRLDMFYFLHLRENPLFATLRDEPRFKKLVAMQDAHVARERAEVEVLRLF